VLSLSGFVFSSCFACLGERLSHPNRLGMGIGSTVEEEGKRLGVSVPLQKYWQGCFLVVHLLCGPPPPTRSAGSRSSTEEVCARGWNIRLKLVVGRGDSCSTGWNRFDNRRSGHRWGERKKVLGHGVEGKKPKGKTG